MFLFPLHSANGVVYDSQFHAIAVIEGMPADACKRAKFIAESLNDPFAAALHETRKRSAISTAGGDDKAAEFWIRLAGNLRKASERINK